MEELSYLAWTVLVIFTLIGVITLTLMIRHKIKTRSIPASVGTINTDNDGFFSIHEAATEMRIRYKSYAKEVIMMRAVKDIFLSGVSDIFGLKLRGKSKDERNDQHILIYEITQIIDGVLHQGFMSLNIMRVLATSIKGNFDINKLEKDVDDFVDIITEVHILYPEPKENTSIKSQIIKDIAKLSAYELSSNNTINEKPSFATLVKSRHNDYYLRYKEIDESWELSQKEIENNYTFFNIRWNNSIKRANPKIITELALSVIDEGLSVALNGLTGVGKTRFQSHIIYEGSKRGINFVLCNAQMLRDLISTNVALDDLLDEDEQYCLVVNEIDTILQEDPSLVKELSDGLLNRAYNLTMLFAFNETYEDKDDIFREGRCILLKVLPLSKEEAWRTANYLNSLTDSDYKFDLDGFKEYIDNLASQEVKLGVIYSFYRSTKIRGINTAIQDLLDTIPEPESQKKETNLALVHKPRTKIYYKPRERT